VRSSLFAGSRVAVWSLVATASVVISGLAVPTASASPRARQVAPQPRVERPMEGWTPSSHWVVNADGTMTRTIYPALTFHSNPDGNWAGVDPRVVEAPASERKAHHDAAGVRDAVRPVHFGLSSDRLMQIDLDGGPVTISASGLTVHAPAVTPSSVTYPSVAPGTDLAFTSKADGLRETLTLANAHAPRRFRFHLADPSGALGLAVRQADGGYRFDKPVADGLFLTMPAAKAWQQGRPTLVQRDRQGRVIPSALMSVRAVPGGFDVTESVNPAWLAGKSFPIVLDPSLVYSSSPTLVDCTINGAVSGQTTTECSNTTATIGADATGPRRFLTLFDLSGLPSPAQIVGAALKLTPTAGSGAAVPVQLREPGAFWTWGVTWLRRTSSNADTWPAGTVGGDPLTTVLGTGSLAPSGSAVSFTSSALTQLVSDWVSHVRPNNGLLVMASSETAPGPGLVQVATSEAVAVNDRPVLSITYNAPPSAPGSVTATRGDQQMSVAWATPADNGSPITGYTIKTYTSSGSLVATGSAAAGATTATVAGLSNGSGYYATVSATNAIGTGPDSAHSNTVTPAGVPFAPTSVIATRGDTSATVSWTAANPNGDALTGNTIKAYAGTTLISSTPVGAVTSGTVTGLTNGIAYTFKVAATNTVGTGSLSAASAAVTPAGVPFAPTSVSAAPGNASAAVSWTTANPNGDAVTGNIIKAYAGATLVSSTSVGAVTSGTVTGLTNGTAYAFTVSATNTVGTGAASSASSAITVGVPAIPTSVTATPGDLQATVSWTAPVPNGAAISGNSIRAYSGATLISTTPVGAVTSGTVTGLTNGTSYTFTVTATNTYGSGGESSASSPVIPAGVPFAPTNVTGTRGDTQVTLSWTAANPNGSTVTGNTIRAYNGATLVSTTSVGAVTSATVSGLTNGTAYTFTVTASNAVGTGPASTASGSVTPAGVPLAPANLTAAAGDQQLSLTWTTAGNNGAALTGYTISTYTGVTLVSTTTAGAAATSAIVTGLTNGTGYYAVVNANNSVGTGTVATSNTVTPAGLPFAPTGVTGTRGDSSAVVSWTAPSGNGAAITGYTVKAYAGATLISTSTVGAVTSTTITGLSNGTAYTFTVAAINSVGTGSPSANSAAVTPAGTPFAPTGVSATGADSAANLSWTAANSNGASVTGNTIRAYDGATLVSTTNVGGVTSATVTGLTNGTAYTFTVAATNSVGGGAVSAVSNAVTPAGVPFTPTNASATPGNASAVLTWSAPAANGSAITGYSLKAYAGATLISTTSVGAVTTGTVTGLTNGTNYTFTVTALNAVGASSPSSPSAAITVGVPSVATGISASLGDTQATVTWTAPAPNGAALTSYTITSWLNGGAVHTDAVTAPATSGTATGLTNGTSYTFTVTATNTYGTGAASSASNPVTPAGVPFAPALVTGTSGDTTATITWTAANPNGSTVTGNTISTYAGATLVSSTTVGPVTTATVTGLTNGTAYTFTVRSTNAIGPGATSAASSPVTPAGVPFAPSSVTAVSGDTTAAITWTAPNNNGSPLLYVQLTVTPAGGTAQAPIQAYAAATQTTLSGLTNGQSYTVSVQGVNLVGTGATLSSAVFTPTRATPTEGAGQFVPVTPDRLVDTRTGLGLGGTVAPLGAGATATITIAGAADGSGNVPVPATGASAVMLSVSAFTQSANGYFTIWPTGAARPSMGQLTWAAGVQGSGSLIAKLGTNGQISVWNSAGTTGLVIEVEGYYTDNTAIGTAGTFVPLTPARVADTRTGLGTGGTVAPIGAGQTLDFTLDGSGGVPATGVQSVAVNITAVNATTTSTVTAYRKGDARPIATSITALASVSARNALVQVAVDSSGKITVYNSAGTTDIVLDVEGYYTTGPGQIFVPVSPTRIYQTSTALNTGGSTAPFAAGETRTITIAGASDASGQVPVPSTGVSAVVLNVEAYQPQSQGYLTGWPTGQSQPTASVLNYPAGSSQYTEAFAAKLGTNGQLNIKASAGTVHLILDVEGYYVATAATPPPAPAVTSNSMPYGGWVAAGSTGPFTVTDTGANNVDHYLYALDDPILSGALSVAPSSGTTATMSLTAPPPGWHTLYVQAVDKANNLSPIVSYPFGEGPGISSPVDGSHTEGLLTLSGGAPAGYSGVTWYYVQGSCCFRTVVPPADVTLAGAAVPAWPVSIPAGTYAIPPTLVWNAAKTLGVNGDGNVWLQACFTPTGGGTSVCSTDPTPAQYVTVTLDQTGENSPTATTPFGPGSLNLLTGNLSLSANDVSVDANGSDLSLARSYNTGSPVRAVPGAPEHLNASQVDAEGDVSGFAGVHATISPVIYIGTSGTSVLGIFPASSGATSDTYAAVGGDSGGMRLGLQGGHSYTLTTHIQVKNLPGALASTRAQRVAVYYATTPGVYTEVDSNAATVAGQWQILRVRFTVPIGAVEAFVRFYNGQTTADLPGGSTSNSVYYDGSSLTDEGVFGPGWQASLPVMSAASTWSGLTDLGTTVRAQDGDGTLVSFARDTHGVWTPTGDDATSGLSLTPGVITSGSATAWTVTDLDGNSTLFKPTAVAWGCVTAPSTSCPHAYVADSVTQGGNGLTTSYVVAASGQDKGRVTTIIAPHPSSVACTAVTTPAGCRVLNLTYNSYGHLNQVNLKTTDGSGAAINLTVACYTYDDGLGSGNTGALVSEWDPRLVTSGGQVNGCGTAVLPTTYGYSNGRLSSITPAGLAASALGYDGSGRLSTATRTHNSTWQNTYGYASETATVVYGTPLTQDGSNPSYRPLMTAAAVTQWAQSDAPTTAVAIFGPGTSPSNTDLRAATVHYLSNAGRPVNSANFAGATATDSEGWQISTTNYDQLGNVISTLDPANRNIALGLTPPPAGLTLPSGSANAAMALSTLNTYSSDRMDLTDVLGPYSLVTVPGSSGQTGARAHTHITYDDGNELAHPLGDLQHLETNRYTAANLSSANTWSSGTETDKHTTVTSYALSPSDAAGWAFGSPMRVTVDPEGLGLSTITRYDPNTGNVIESRMPSNPGGGGVGTTLTTYYTAQASGQPADNPNCVNTAWVNLPCKTQQADSTPTSGLPSLVTTQVTAYDYLNRARTTIETVQNDGTGTTRTRTTTVSYENGGYSPRLTQTSLSGGVGTAVPATNVGYDPSTGLPTTAGNGTSTITTGYDDFGRSSSYNDGNGNIATTLYDSAGRVSSAHESGTNATINYSYNAGGERRNLPTSLIDSVLGTFTASYAADGELATELSPNGTTLSLNRDTTGQVTHQLVTQGGTTLLDESVHRDIAGREATRDTTMTQNAPGGSTGGSWAYTYDGAGRLRQVSDTPIGGTCTVRAYAFDGNSNRLSSTNFASGSSTCQTTSGSTVTHHYDAADRLLSIGTDTGLAYDAYGRTTTLPANDVTSGTGAVTTSYYSNDLVRNITQGVSSQTFGLDAAGRLATRTYGNSTTTTNHYDDPGDSPGWTAEASGGWTRNASDLTGGLAAVVNQAGTTTWEVSNLHGDIVLAQAGGTTTGYASDEFGNPRGATSAGRYGWLGAADRATDTPGSLTLMGVRLYSSALGRFLQVDPIVGGSCNSYEYACQEPMNNADPSGLSLPSEGGSAACSCDYGYGKGARKDLVYKGAWEYTRWIRADSHGSWTVAALGEDLASVLSGAALGGVISKITGIMQGAKFKALRWAGLAGIGVGAYIDHISAKGRRRWLVWGACHKGTYQMWGEWEMQIEPRVTFAYGIGKFTRHLSVKLGWWPLW
jgi:RHS repeat-associated protein